MDGFKMHRSHFSSGFVVMSVALLLAACGGGNNGSMDGGHDVTPGDSAHEGGMDAAMDTGHEGGTTDVVGDTVGDTPMKDVIDVQPTDGGDVTDVQPTDVPTDVPSDVVCPTGRMDCSGTCVDTQTDSNNCGSCGHVCTTGTGCVAGTCSAGCAAPNMMCGTACVNTQTDANNCGSCGNVCPSGQVCDTGSCRTPCVSPLMMCGAVCVDPQTDPTNCGTCGNACPSGQVCMAGACSTSCLSPMTMCGTGSTAVCTNLQTDSMHCGTCGTACPTGQSCVSGACVLTCTGGQTACGTGASMTCVNLQTDANNCGRCGTVCPSGQTCQSGMCTLVCATGEITCGTGSSASCVNPQTDANNCGGCGNVCPSGQSCVGGACVLVCPSGQTACGAGAGMTCVNTQTDPANCGTCGTVCPGTQVCQAGTCTLVCAAGLTVCGSGAAMTCVNTQSDATNCGACGNACPAGDVCTGGACVPFCMSPNMLCGTACINVLSDPANCGTCGNACPAGQLCNSGSCSLTCAAPNTVCGSGASMMCVNLQTDNNHCGTCSTVCAAGTTCITGVCRPVNDECVAATPITVPSPSAVTTVTGSTTGATNSSGTCVSQGADVFYTFTLAQRSIVYIDTFGSSFDTFVSIRNGCATAPVNCTDDSCAGFQSQIVTVLNAGTHQIELGGFVGSSGTAASGNFTLHFEVEPAANGANTGIAPSATMQSHAGTTAGTGTVAGSCGNMAPGPEDALYWTTCPADTMHSFHATTCGGATWDTVLYERSPGRTPSEVCNDDESCTCGTRSSITSSIPAGAGLHVMYVDGFTTVAEGAYTVQFIEDACDAGFTSCSGTCLQTTCFQSDNANCGACGNTCTLNSSCTAGSCVPVNSTCAAPTALTLAASGMTTTVNATNRNAPNATNACGGANIFYSFTLSQQEYVYVDTYGSSFDTLVGFGPVGCGTAATCNDDSCGTFQSQLVQLLGAGTHVIALGGYLGATGNITLHIQHIPATGATGATIPNGTGTVTVTGNNTGAATSMFAACGATTNAAETVNHPWLTCPGSAAGAVTASTCGGATFDTMLEYRDGFGGTSTCNDDACALQSALPTTMTAAGAGLHLISLKGFAAGETGAYTITVGRP